VETQFSICDPGGRLVWSTVLPATIAGATAITWNGTDLQGQRVPSGIYYYRLRAGDHRANGKAMLLR
jgi:flagellar hook assembly protein FlgD